ncbi:MAG: hypothetical protein ACD_7C00347G0001 [uncultured bacterium]|nr:MAG: hypothetical protein ACD_7C00347G0001 [uncultured bacterium]KKP68675.1 MAG: hypothetical protein UR66_C0004G0075 [Candidatus Moranbacteria bacterium GW2011_GWE1_35_17]KKP73218.1 MAG: hypothetical protein UR65_C0005G0004 [Candidatus Moranbacteria bacterium GW2011_GWE2_35_164]KKP84644.1 MAG: hypothetical protein UR82_C0001G0011 [Candidatus Moranbacteria bacterium GW2011_GWF1_35_5]KKP85006.1 MAG: hypothetical protein UR83_C0006G0008 [Candidatus Moranbacteria bacterium GW2011_GWF2_35_54]HB
MESIEQKFETREKINEKFIIDLIESDQWRMEVLRAVKELNLPDWLIGAGFVRNPVLDKLHNFNQATPITDIDVAYFDLTDLSEESEIKYQNFLKEKIETDWSVTNQARMEKINNQNKDYVSTKDAIAHWPETATAIGVTMLENGSLKVIAPHGLDDLFSLKLRMTPDFGDGRDAFLARISKKQWLSKWPKLKIV